MPGSGGLAVRQGDLALHNADVFFTIERHCVYDEDCTPFITFGEPLDTIPVDE